MNKIYVIKNSQHFGTLLEEKNIITFTYANNIEEKSYIKGLKEKVNTSTTLFPVFQNLLPEHHQLELLIEKHNIKTQIGILLYLNNIHGSYEFYNERDFQTFTPSKQPIYNYNDISDEILESSYTFPNILNYTLDIKDEILFPEGLVYDQAMGLSGYQYKFSIDIDHNNSKISYNRGNNGLYIMKPYNKHMASFNRHTPDEYIPYLLLNEHLFMSFAKEFGFKIPYNAIIRHNDEFHYIIKRYDRYDDIKFDHKEILTFMLKPSSEKYNVTMKEVLLTAKENVEKNELIYLFKFIVFSIIIAHGDLHAKNISLIEKQNILEEQEFMVSPFYDISTTKIYKSLKMKDIGLKVGNKLFKINKEQICTLAESIEIEKSNAIEIIDEVALLFTTKFKDYIQNLPDDIKGLQVKKAYGSFVPLEVILNNYYDTRITYIKDYLQVQSVIDLKNNEENIW